MILLSDANVLIDLGHVGGLGVLQRISETEVLDLVLLECEHESQPDLVKEVLASGVKVVTTERAWLTEAGIYHNGPLSIQDALCLYYAKKFGRALLAGDRPLRERCLQEGVEIRGTIWIVEEAFNQGLVPAVELCRWLKAWPWLNRRLPKGELRRLEKLMGC